MTRAQARRGSRTARGFGQVARDPPHPVRVRSLPRPPKIWPSAELSGMPSLMVLRTRTGILPCAVALLLGLGAGACKGGKDAPREGIVSLSAPTIDVAVDPATFPKPNGPRLGAVQMTAPIYQKPDRRSPKIG